MDAARIFSGVILLRCDASHYSNPVYIHLPSLRDYSLLIHPRSLPNTKFYIPHLDEYSKKEQPRFQLEYMTYDVSVLNATLEYPVPHHLLPLELRNGTAFELGKMVQPSPRDIKDIAPYALPDLTIDSWLELARRLGSGKHRKLWKRFKAYMYMDW